MGNKIKVDHSKFGETADVIDSYISYMTAKMNDANKNVFIMFASWKGEDAFAFKGEWNKINDTNSTYGRMKKSLESYSEFLRYAGHKYKEAQAKSINEAQKLKKY